MQVSGANGQAGIEDAAHPHAAGRDLTAGIEVLGSENVDQIIGGNITDRPVVIDLVPTVTGALENDNDFSVGNGTNHGV